MTIFDIIDKINHFSTHFLLPGLFILVAIIKYLSWEKKHPKPKQLKVSRKKAAHGMIFGKKGSKVVFSPEKKEGHLLVLGGSGSGKSSALLIPLLLSLKNSTSFTIDIAGDIQKAVKNKMPNLLVYEPDNTNTIPYDIFAPIDSLENEDDKNESLEALSFLLMPAEEHQDDAARFFNTEGRKILTAALIAFYHQGLDFIEICEKIVHSSWQDLFRSIDATGYEKGINYINGFVGANEKNTAGCKQAADSCIALFANNERIKRTIRRPTDQELSYTPSRLENYNVLVLIEDSKLTLYKPLLQVITAQSLDYFSARPNDSKNTIFFCLDEFASLGYLDIMAALRKYRKKKVRIAIFTQSLADLDLIYGKAARMAMLTNFQFKALLSVSDTDSQEYFAKLIGTETDQDNKKTWAIDPEQLAYLGNHLILIHPDGYMKLKKNFYFKR